MARPKRSKETKAAQIAELQKSIGDEKVLVTKEVIRTPVIYNEEVAKTGRFTWDKTKKESFIKPLVTFDGQKHILQEMLEETPEEFPEMTAIGAFNLKVGRHTWVSYKIKFKGDKILSMEVTEPDMQAIAVEAAKVEFVTEFQEKET